VGLDFGGVAASFLASRAASCSVELTARRERTIHLKFAQRPTLNIQLRKQSAELSGLPTYHQSLLTSHFRESPLSSACRAVAPQLRDEGGSSVLCPPSSQLPTPSSKLQAPSSGRYAITWRKADPPSPSSFVILRRDERLRRGRQKGGLGYHLTEGREESFHLGFLADGETHVVRQGRE
jgi:hypothetical protein